MTQLEKVSHEFMKFMRGKYRLDEIGDGKDELKFKQGKRTIVTVYTHEDKFTFLIIFGKKEREIFEANTLDYSEWLLGCYESAQTYHDGKWMFIDVTETKQLEEIKKLIYIKKKPNRKPFPKENAIYSCCGHRCDLCIHYIGMSEELRRQIEPLLTEVWDVTDWSMRCGGCNSDNCYCKDEPCAQKICAVEKGIKNCTECADYPCINAGVSNCTSMIHTKVLTADDVTWAILPYAPMQYEDI
ncbi:MAG: DUF3788 family protein [Eubacterium sp.]|nr:DUF3788 family protein [Eubacterium sp.]